MPDPSTEQWQEIQTHRFAGRKIQAIKVYRLATGCDLKEAKDAMEAYDAKLRAEAPDRFTARAKSGCFSVILLSISLLAAVLVANRLIS